MNIVYFGSDVFLSCFEFLAEHHRVLALYTYHNEEDYFTEYAITRRAAERGIPIHYESISPEEIRRCFTQEGCDLFFIAEYDRILRLPEDLPAFRGINTHSSLLPQGCGYYPIESAMARGITRTGVTMHKVAPQVDSGQILAKRALEITPDMDSVDVYLRNAANARQMLEELLEDLEGAWQRAVPQREHPRRWKRPDPSLLTLRHDQTRAEASQVFRRANSMTQVQLEGRWYYVSALLTGPAPLERAACQIAADRWLYRAADGHLRLTVHPIPERKCDK